MGGSSYEDTHLRSRLDSGPAASPPTYRRRQDDTRIRVRQVRIFPEFSTFERPDNIGVWCGYDPFRG